MLIETPRLLIRSFIAEDVEPYARIVAKPEVVRHLHHNTPHSYEEARNYILRNIEQEKAGELARYAVTMKPDGLFIGFCGYKKIGKQTDLGWRYDSLHWGKGYGTEAAKAVFGYGVNELKLDNIMIGANADNIASLKIAQKLNLPHQREGSFNGHKVMYYYQQAPDDRNA